MGNELLSCGDGWYITRSGNEIQILLYHYCHYNAMYRMLFEFHDPQERYSAFQQKPPIEFQIDWKQYQSKTNTVQLEYSRIGRDSGSALDEYGRLGSPEEVSVKDLIYLKHRSEPVRRVEMRDSLENITVTVKPLEIVQIIITNRE